MLLSLLLGCGFHLRGNVAFPERFNPVYIDATDLSAAERKLIFQTLQQASATVASEPAGANRLAVRLRPLQSRVLASSSPTGVELRQLSIQLNYRLEDAGGVELVKSRQIDQQAEIELEKSNVLTHEDQLKNMALQLQRSLIQRMVFQLGHL